jgi:two-component system, oxyanion-binding sensor
VAGILNRKKQLRIGFVPLIDASPLIAAFELGFFAEENLAVVLERQIGWGNVRDKLTFGSLDASHALLGMPAASAMHWPRYPEPLVSILSLGLGGNGITISRRLFDAGVTNSASLARWIMRLPRGQKPLLLAHVFDCSTHHYLLRDWLSNAQINPDQQVRLCVLPPPQMVRQMSNGYVACFCVGEPWNIEAEISGCGKVLCVSTDVVAAHPEKVLAVTRRWLDEHPEAAERIVRALMRAADFCGDTANRGRLVEILARPQYLSVAEQTLARSFELHRHVTPPVSSFYCVSTAVMFPSATHVAWLLSQMARWGHVIPEVVLRDVATRSVDSTVFRAVADSMGLECPSDDFPAMNLRTGTITIDSLEPQNALTPTA